MSKAQIMKILTPKDYNEKKQSQLQRQKQLDTIRLNEEDKRIQTE